MGSDWLDSRAALLTKVGFFLGLPIHKVLYPFHMF